MSDRRKKPNPTRVKSEAARLVAAISSKSAGAPNETSLVHEIEVGTAKEHTTWKSIFGFQNPAYRGRKGITTDLNGAYFVKVIKRDGPLVYITNEPKLGKKELPTITMPVEDNHLFPLLRGRGVAPFKATVDATYHILVPQRGMHGDPDLPSKAPRTYSFLSRFEKFLKERSSYRKFQSGTPYWSLWSTGAYSFAPYKVLWREMPGGSFAAAYLGKHKDSILGRRLVIPDHKL